MAEGTIESVAQNGYAGYGYGAAKYDNGAEMIAAGGVCDLRHEVGELKGTIKDAECDIRHDVKDAESQVRFAIKDAESTLRKDVTDVRFQVAQSAKETHDRISDFERNVDTMFCKTNENIREEAGRTRDKAQDLARWRDDKEEARFLRTWDKVEKNDDKLDAFRAEVADRFCKENERELQSKIDELRAKVQCCECPPTSATEVADVVIQRLVNLNILGGQGLK